MSKCTFLVYLPCIYCGHTTTKLRLGYKNWPPIEVYFMCPACGSEQQCDNPDCEEVEDES